MQRGTTYIASYDSPPEDKLRAMVVVGSTAAQAKINYMLSRLSTTGAIVEFAEGTYNLSASLVVPSFVTLRGQGRHTRLVRNSTLVSSNATAIEVVGTIGTRKSQVNIERMSITGPSASGAMVNGSGILVSYADYVAILECEITKFGAAGDDGGVHLLHATNCRVSRGRYYDNLNGVITAQATGVTAPDCTDIMIANNLFYSNWADGTHGQNSSRITFTGNISYLNTESGIDLLGCTDCTITGNVCHDNAHEGIEIGQTVTTGQEDRGHTVTGNTCYNNHTNTGLSGGGGILLSGKSTYCTVTGNACRFNQTYGISAGATSASLGVNNNVISGNMTDSNVQGGIHLFGNSTDNLVTANTVKNNGPRGIDMTTSNSITPTSNAIINNDLANNTTAIFRSGGIDATHTIRGNKGWTTEARGVASVANTGTITHGLAAAPAKYGATATVAGHIATVTAASSTTITIGLTNHDGTAIAVAENVAWWAEV